MTRAPLAPDRWRRIEEIFHASIDLPEEDRSAYVSRICGSDEQLRIEIEGLLAADHEGSHLITGIVDEVTARMLEDDLAARRAAKPDAG